MISPPEPQDGSPAERFAASRRRTAESSGPLGDFRADYAFELDDFQVRACHALQEGQGVLVAAPTGSGKTVVGEFAVHLALATGRKAFYTTPIKALSNQKYADLARRYGPESVGLLTGDNTINGEAPIVVMTTEVLRNMLYAGSSTLDGLGYVVMDEVHYLADRFRGAVWEEVIIHLPETVKLVSLSATVSNAEEFGDWLAEVRGDTAVIVSEHRPVPLWQHVLAPNGLHDLFADDRGSTRVNPQLRQLGREVLRRDRGAPSAATRQGGGRSEGGRRGARQGGGRGEGRHAPRLTATRPDAVAMLDRAGLLPAIVFIFSRAGCDGAVAQCLAAGVRLTNNEERLRIREVIQERCRDIPEEDLAVLGFWEWAEALERGVATHHAGLLPSFKEVVEELFSTGLVKVVFATETLALGVNMPARSVVLEKLVKWNGETHADVTPGEYTQLTGRAGRRGIDIEGHAVVLWTPALDAEAVAGLASTRTYPLRSSFRPTYNMAVNLVGHVGRAKAREILETSFAQFQADRGVVGLARQARRHEEALAGYTEAMTCHLGDFTEYAALRRQISDREHELSRSATHDRRTEAIAALARLRRGDVIKIPSGRRAGWAVVVEPGADDGHEGPRPTVVTAERQVHRLSTLDVPSALEPLTRVPVPKAFNPRNPQARRDLASTLRNALAETGQGDVVPARRLRPGAADEDLHRMRLALRNHPCHGCADREDHARWAERWWRLRRESQALAQRIESRTNTIARTFDRVCDLLDERGYLTGDTVTLEGRRLTRLYAETDLLVAECLREGAWKDLDPPSLAACVSTVVYQSRGDAGALSPRLPSGRVREAIAQTRVLWEGIEELERAHRLQPSPEPDPGLAWATHRWASGFPLEKVLREADLAAGDFVRWTKQVIDLLGQIQQASSNDAEDASLRRAAGDAVDALRRGVVAYSSLS